MTSPDNDASWAALEEMLTNAEDFYQALEVPYQVIRSRMCPVGRMSNAPHKKTTYWPEMQLQSCYSGSIFPISTGGEHCQR